MDPFKRSLYDYLVQKGVKPDTAKKAVQECAGRYIRNYILGTARGLGPEAFIPNPPVILMGVARGNFRDAATMIGAPSTQRTPSTWSSRVARS